MVIPDIDTNFLWRIGMAVVFSFLIGLEFHRYQRSEGQGIGYGTTRTLTLVGIMGFLLAAMDPDGWLFALGLAVLALWLGLYYQQRLKENYPSLMAPVVCVLVYLLGLLVWRVPQWLVAAYTILIIFMLSAKPRIRAFSDTVSGDELATVVKFVIMAGVVLPLLPDREIASFVPVTYRHTWLAVVAVSGISYGSYVAQTYIYKTRGTLLTGVLGGLYSSTATTFVLGNQAQQSPGNTLVSPALILATAMMYIRLLALAVVLAPASAIRLAPPFVAATLLSGVAAFLLTRLPRSAADTGYAPPSKHPLEFNAALLFALLFVLFATVTQFVVTNYSDTGLRVLAFVVGVTDIDPFVLSLLSGHQKLGVDAIIGAVIIASASNNLLKAAFAAGLARNRSVLFACLWLVLLAAGSLVYVWI